MHHPPLQWGLAGVFNFDLVAALYQGRVAPRGLAPMERRTRVVAQAALLLLGAPIVAGAAGALATAGAPAFYEALAKPSWAPPPALFGPVWTALYLLMGIAAFLVWRSHGWNGALVLFVVQLVPNALWSWLFFRWRLGVASIVDIGVLLLMVAFLVVRFFRFRPLSGVLLLPYLGWVMYATALNIAIVRASPSL